MVEIYTCEDGVEVKCRDLTYGFLLDVETGEQEETPINVIANSTGLTSDEIKNFRRSDVNNMTSVIMRLTYPELFDENGNQIETDNTDDVDGDKKKSKLLRC